MRPGEQLLLALIAALFYMLPFVVVRTWRLAGPWRRGPSGLLWREEKRGDDLWLVVWSVDLRDAEAHEAWALRQLDERHDLFMAEHWFPQGGDLT